MALKPASPDDQMKEVVSSDERNPNKEESGTEGVNPNGEDAHMEESEPQMNQSDKLVLPDTTHNSPAHETEEINQNNDPMA